MGVSKKVRSNPRGSALRQISWSGLTDDESLASLRGKVLRAATQLSLKRLVAEIEELVLRAALEHTGGNGTRAAKFLSTSYRVFQYKLHKYNIQAADYRVRAPRTFVPRLAIDASKKDL